jgi:hypothetical protein
MRRAVLAALAVPSADQLRHFGLHQFLRHRPHRLADHVAMLIAQHLPDDLLDRHPVPTGHRRPPFVEALRTPTIMSAAVGGTTSDPSDRLLRRAGARLGRFASSAAKGRADAAADALASHPRPSLLGIGALVPLPDGLRPPRFPLRSAAPSLFAGGLWPALSVPVRPGRRGPLVVAGHVRRCPVRLGLWRGKDSNLRRRSHAVYSRAPLTAREPRQAVSECSDQAAIAVVSGRPGSTS